MTHIPGLSDAINRGIAAGKKESAKDDCEPEPTKAITSTCKSCWITLTPWMLQIRQAKYPTAQSQETT